MRRATTFLLTGALLVAAGVLVWPLPTSPRSETPADAMRVTGKSAYLREVEARVHTMPGSRPNVLLIVADDLARHDLSHAGGRPGVTPRLDALAARGVRFTDAYATAAICAPSRAALLTGRYQNRFGFESQPMQRYVRNLGEYLAFRYLLDTDAMQPFLERAYPDAGQRLAQGLPSSEITLAEVFRAAGYATGAFGKWHLGYGPVNRPQDFGFERQYGFVEAFTLYADEDDTGIESHRHDLFWERHIWHAGRSGPSAVTRDGVPVHEARYLTDAIAEEARAFIARAADEGRRFFAYVPFSAPHTPFQALREDYDAIHGARDHNERVYLAMIRRLDRAVGTLLDFLDERHLTENTVIVFTSDNGGAAYTHATTNGGLRGGKFTQFEGGLAVPLIVSWPGRIAPHTDSRPALLTDLFATFTSLLGVGLAADRTYDSSDLLAPSSGDAVRPRFWRSDFNRAVRIGRWKLVHDKRTDSALLFDLSEDPFETTDVAAQNAQTVQRLLEALDGWETELEPARWPRAVDYLHSDEHGERWFAI